MSSYPLRLCPICGDDSREVLFRQHFAVVEDATPIGGYDVAVCSRCGFAYADGIPDQATFDRYYREMSKYEYAQRGGAESEFDRRRLDVIADTLAARLPSRDVRVLDVGCASGRLLANLRERGFLNVVGLDPSPACALAADRLYAIPVRSMTLSELSSTGEKFDVLVMVGVLEHLRDLDAAYRHVKAVLTEDGTFFVEVPDVTAFADWDNAPYQDFSTEHINFFSPASLANVMRKHGFSPVFLEQNHREQSYRTTMSNISAAFRKGRRAESTFEPDVVTKPALHRYLDQCAAEDERLSSVIDRIVDSARPIVVWGVGTHTSRLLATSRLPEAEIVAFIESNSRYHGKSLQGRPILPPAALKNLDEGVLVSSRVFQNEIAQQIRSDLGCSNELILLYNV
jgi:SAM-dependent methyltransferase